MGGSCSQDRWHPSRQPSAKRYRIRNDSATWVNTGRSIVENHFSWDVAVDRLLQVYEEVLATGSGSPDVQSRRS